MRNDFKWFGLLCLFLLAVSALGRTVVALAAMANRRGW